MTQKQANMILVTVSIGWGTSYIFMKLCVDSISPFAIVGALLCGIFIALMYGLKTTSASSAGFLTSTTVILVPILQIFITRKLPSQKITYGILIVSIGLALLTIEDDFTITAGSLFCLLAAFLYAVYIIVTNHFIKEIDALQLGIYQLGFAGLYATIGNLLFETLALPNEAIHWFAILGLALICSAYGFVVQPIAQKYTTPESTGFIFSLEPIFSAIFAFIFLHENMGIQGYIGALIILIGVLIANSTSKRQLLQKEMTS